MAEIKVCDRCGHPRPVDRTSFKKNGGKVEVGLVSDHQAPELCEPCRNDMRAAWDAKTKIDLVALAARTESLP